MTSSANANANSQTPRNASTNLSPISSTATISPTWVPKSPLSPHRLAKLANALGVSTPLPAVHQPSFFMTRSHLDSPTSFDTFRRSPTPSTQGSNLTAYSPAVSKYLLHVIPPLHLPHDAENDTDMTPPPPNASGYHTQFRRGTLVPVHSNLQSQLAAIAKEYALPSTAGLILYLVTSLKSPLRSPTPGMLDEEAEEPGPRLSEDIWKHLWTRVLKVEQRDDALMPPPRSPLGMTLGAQSTPYLPQEASSQSLRPFLSATTENLSLNLHSTPFPPSPTSPSTVSDHRSNTQSAPPSESSTYDPETPDTSSLAPSILKDPEARANSLDLPGLTSPSLIPILAKVEFDIDRRKAAWYDPWIRSRRMNHAKRAESRNGRQGSRGDSEEASNSSQEQIRRIDLLTGNKEAQSALLSSAEETLVTEPEEITDHQSAPEGYAELDGDELEEDMETDHSDDEEFEPPDRVVTLTQETHKDALADIFGTDEETWAEMRGSNRNSNRHINPNVVNLALSAADLTALPSPTESEFETLGKEGDEVQALLEQMSKSTPSSPIATSPTLGNKKHVPPPLTLVLNSPQQELAIPTDPLPTGSDGGGLAYLEQSPAVDDQVEDEFEMDYSRMKSPAESEKRGGAVFDDLDLGLDPTEDYDESDPHDRRRSQFLMMAQLDEIEKTLAQLSPRILKNDLAEEQNYLPLSPNNSLTLSPGILNADYYPPSPRLPQYPEGPDSPPSQSQAAWPATPFSSIRAVTPPPRQDSLIPSPPRLAVNGITTSAPKSFVPNSSGEMSAESQTRKRELEEEQGYRKPLKPQGSNESPIIPLSPDPFGRFSSTPADPSKPSHTSAYWDKDAVPEISASSQIPPVMDPDGRKRSTSTATTSRFSADSLAGIEANSNNDSRSNRATLMSMSTFKKLWRKSTKSTTSSNPPSTPSATSFPLVPPVPVRPERPPSQEQSDEPPKTPILDRLSMQPVPRRSQDLPPLPPQAPQQLSPPLPPQQQPQRTIPQPQPQPQNVPQQPSQTLTTPALTPPPRSPIPHPQELGPPRQRPPTPHAQHQQQYSISVGHPSQQAPGQQLIVPPPAFNGRSANPQPIVATQMRPSRSNSTLDRFQFDQESPYPITRRPQASPRPASPPPLPSPSPQTTHLPLPIPTMQNIALPAPMLPPTPSQERPNVRKSILKGWKSSSISSTASSQQGATLSESRSSLERPNAGAARVMRPNVLNSGSSRTSVTSPPPDVPPSPQIPQQFISRGDNRQSIRSRLTNSSIDSGHSQLKSNGLGAESTPRRSIASSRSSQESRPSVDVSQFEMVSPRMGSAL